MASQSAKDAAKARKREARQASLTLLDGEGLEVFRLAAKECGLSHYSQKDAAGSRRHFRVSPHEVPHTERGPATKRDADPSWYLIPDKQIRRIDPKVLSNLRNGVTIGKDFQAVERSSP